MKSFAKAASTSRTERVFLQDATSTTGAGLAGLTFASSGLTWYYIRSDQATATAITPVTMTVGTWVSAGFTEIDATNMPGWYELGLPDAAIVSGRSVQMMIKGATNLSPHPFEIEVTAVDFQSAVAFMTSIGSVTGNVAGSIAGNVNGNVLGSITGNVGGNVVGSVGSVTGLTTSTITTSVVAGMSSSPVGTVTGGVTVSTNNDKTGYGLASTQSFDHTGQTTKLPATLAAVDVTGNLPADLQTVKTQAVTAAAAVTFPAAIGTSTYAGADTAGTTTLLTRIPGIIPANGSGFTSIAAVGAVTGAVGSVTAPVTLANASITTATFATGATIPRATLVDTVTTYTGNTPQTGDAFGLFTTPRLTRLDNLLATGTYSTYAGSDTAGTATLLTRIPGTIPADGSGFTTLGDTRLTYLDAAVSSRSTYAGGAVASVTAGVIVTTNNDKVGYGLATGSILSTSFAAGATIPRVALTDVLTTYTGNTPQTGDAYTRLGSPIGASLSADIQTRSTYTGADTDGTVTLLTRIPGTIPANGSGFTALGDTRMANLDAAVSSRSTYAGGAVASVTGDVGGNVTGSVGSVTAGVTVATNNDKAGYGLAAGSVASATFAAGATLPRVALVDTLTTYTGNTPQTGDSFPRLGAPAGASIAADIQTRSTYAGTDTPGTTTLVARIPAVMPSAAQNAVATVAMMATAPVGSVNATVTAVLSPAGLDAISAALPDGLPGTFPGQLVWAAYRLGLGRVVQDKDAHTFSVFRDASASTPETVSAYTTSSAADIVSAAVSGP